MSTHDDGSGAHLRVRRYSGTARINHWIVAISFVLLLAITVDYLRRRRRA